MKGIHIFLSVVFSLALLFVVLISSIEIAVYADMGYFQKEYEKYNVLQTVSMKEKDLLYVTEEMMSYLKGNREDLNVETIIDGKTTEFFNEKEKAHMKDVKVLFLGGQFLRKVGSMICLLIGIFFIWKKQQKVLFQTVRIVMLCFAAITIAIATIISTNFSKYFTLFHEIFFSNHLWLLNPHTDRLINIVPQPFFVDTAIRIGIIFGGMMLCIFLVCSILLNRTKKKTGV